MNRQENYGQKSNQESGQTVKSNPLVVVGTVAIDSIKTPFGERAQAFGGSASYFSYAASFFNPVKLVGVVGRDFPDEFRKILEERPIDLHNLQMIEGKTFHWKGSYENDMNAAETLETHLNVLAEFNPKVRFEEHPSHVFLANIDPDLQLKVLDQMEPARLKFVAADTMNFWIASKLESLKKVLARVDCIVLNDGEARQLTGEVNLVQAAQKIQDMGPGYVVIKKGEHGALVRGENHFFALPAFPLESVFDPTGAGDSFAGGMMGYLTSTADLSFENMKRAVAFGTIIASFAVEDFSLDSLRRTTMGDVEERLELFKRISSF